MSEFLQRFIFCRKGLDHEKEEKFCQMKHLSAKHVIQTQVWPDLDSLVSKYCIGSQIVI